MLTLSVRVGEGVKVGKLGYIYVLDKNGRSVRLVFNMDERPIQVVEGIVAGIIPRHHHICGISDESQPAVREYAAA